MINGSQNQRDAILRLREHRTGQEYNQGLVCQRLGILASVASQRMRELMNDGLVDKIKYIGEKGHVAYYYKRHRSGTEPHLIQFRANLGDV
jgi:predicted transcriptional regulator